MLTPEYLAECPDYILGLYDELDRAIIADISRRIVKTGGITPTAEHQIDKVQQSGMLMDDVVRNVAKVSEISEVEVRDLFEASAIESMEYDANPFIKAGVQKEIRMSRQMEQLLHANIAKTNYDLKNLTMTTGMSATDAYMNAVNMAFMQAQSGAFTYAQAIRNAVKAAIIDGNFVLFPSGHRDRLDVAVRRSVLTGLNQTTAKLTEMYSEDLGAEYYEVSAHAGARPSHEQWQGQVYKINGSDRNYPNFADSTGYGTGDGLCGWGCRHGFHPFFPGISLPAYDKKMLDEYKREKYQIDGNSLTEYDLSQMMRARERDIRATKREICGYQAAMDATTDPKIKAELKADHEAAAIKLKEQQKRYKDLCQKTDHRPDSVRTSVVAHKDDKGRIVAFDRSAAQRANWAYKKRRKK